MDSSASSSAALPPPQAQIARGKKVVEVPAAGVLGGGAPYEPVHLLPSRPPVTPEARRFARWSAFRNFSLSAGAAVGVSCYIYMALTGSMETAAAQRTRVCAALQADHHNPEHNRHNERKSRGSSRGNGSSAPEEKGVAVVPRFQAPSTFKQLALHRDVLVQAAAATSTSSGPVSSEHSDDIDGGGAGQATEGHQQPQPSTLFASLQHFRTSRLHLYMYDMAVEKWNRGLDALQVSLLDACVAYAETRRARAEAGMKKEIAARLGHHDVHDVSFLSHASALQQQHGKLTDDQRKHSKSSNSVEGGEGESNSSSPSSSSSAEKELDLRETVYLTELKPIGLVFPPAVASTLLLLLNTSPAAITAMPTTPEQEEEHQALMRQLLAARGIGHYERRKEGGGEAEDPRAVQRRVYQSITTLRTRLTNMQRTAAQIHAEREEKKQSSLSQQQRQRVGDNILQFNSSSPPMLEKGRGGGGTNAEEATTGGATSGFFRSTFHRVSNFLDTSKKTNPHEVVLLAPPMQQQPSMSSGNNSTFATNDNNNDDEDKRSSTSWLPKPPSLPKFPSFFSGGGQ